jgi:hypothetical protein
MAIVTLTQAKAFLDIYHAADDDKITALLNGALDEAAQYMGYDKIQEFEDFLNSSDNIGGFDVPPESVATAVKLLLQAKYQTPADEIVIFRNCCESLLYPFRINLGV